VLKIKQLTISTEFVKVSDMEKAFVYLRVSGKGQVGGDGFDRQLLAIKKYAKANGIQIVRVFREEGVSGANDLENRPALGELYAALAVNGTKMVLVENLQRLARDLMVQESLIASFQRKGFELVSVTEPDILEAEPSRVLMRQIFGAINQYEKAMIVSKLKGARQRMKAKTGRCEGRKAYGFREGERDVIARIKKLRVDGLTLQAVADVLNADGVKTRADKQWTPVQVNRVVGR
jgi:DNA invertase Pin-like site-specific DNA recombinase